MYSGYCLTSVKEQYLKILHLNYSDSVGGAAKAAFRIHQSLSKAGHQSELWVNKPERSEPSVFAPKGYFTGLKTHLRSEISRLLCRRQIRMTGVFHSLSLLPSAWPQFINASDADILHLHWINAEMLSIKDIAKINKPIVWTLHDMWAFSGAEHLSYDERWRNGYAGERNGLTWPDWNRSVWKRKKRHWKKPLSIVTPSNWLGRCVSESPLMAHWPREVIPNCLDTEYWRPFDKISARELLNLPQDKPLICFGSFGGNAAFHKGGDLLQEALKKLETEIPGLEVVIFGSSRSNENLGNNIPTHYLGHLHDEFSMRAVYSASDALIVPSRNDNFPGVAYEAMACGTPVVAFDICGLTDIVDHKINGYLASAFDVLDLARGTSWVLKHKQFGLLSSAARTKVQEYFSEEIVAEKYIERLYQMLQRPDCYGALQIMCSHLPGFGEKHD